MKVITFSRNFPTYHPRKGEQTCFVEKILAGLSLPVYDQERGFDPRLSVDAFAPKHNTIRAGNRFKVGDYFSPRVWSGRPYNSKQITIAPDLQVKKVWDFGISSITGNYFLNTNLIPIDLLKVIALNDGFEELDDFECWFPGRGFAGQVICWNDQVNY